MLVLQYGGYPKSNARIVIFQSLFNNFQFCLKFLTPEKISNLGALPTKCLDLIGSEENVRPFAKLVKEEIRICNSLSPGKLDKLQ